MHSTCFSLLVLFLVLIGCKSENNKNNDYDSHVLDFEKEKMLVKYHKDSLNVEHVSVINSDEKIYKRFKLVNGEKNGLEQGYFPSGNIECKRYYVNDTLEGKSIWYYDTKKIKSIYMYESGRIVGNQKEFHKNGSLKRYFSTNFKEEIVFDIQYDENNKEKSRSLNNKYKTMGVLNSTDLNKNDTIKYTAYFSTPKNVKIKYFYSLDPIEQDGHILKKVELSDSKIKFDTIINNEGTYLLTEKIEINDISLDSIFFEKHLFKIVVK